MDALYRELTGKTKEEVDEQQSARLRVELRIVKTTIAEMNDPSKRYVTIYRHLTQRAIDILETAGFYVTLTHANGMFYSGISW